MLHSKCYHDVCVCLHISDSVPVLSHQSLLSLASYIKIDTMQSISYELGIPYEDIIEMKVTILLPFRVENNIDTASRHSKAYVRFVQMCFTNVVC